MPSAQKTMALLLTKRATVQANSRSAVCAGVGCRVVTTLRSLAPTSWLSAVWIRSPEPTRLRSCALRPRARRPAGAICSTRMLAFAAKTASASALYDGAISTSTNCLATCSAQARSTSPLKAMMPPKAEVGSVLSAFAYAVGAVVGDGDAARVGVLDDHARRRGEALDAFPRRVGVGDVVVRELLALQLPGRDERARRRARGRDRTRRAGAGSRRSAGPAA